MKTTSTLMLLALVSPVLAVNINNGGTAVPNQGLYTLVTETITVNFNDGLLPSVFPVVYEGVAGNIATGNISGVTATPPNDTSAYLTLGPNRGTTVTIRFSRLMDYFGFYAGSLDTYNFADFYQGNTLVLALTGTGMATIGGFAADGNQGNGMYVNVYSSNASEYFDRIVLRSTSNAFETDNHAFRSVERSVTTVHSPEPATLGTIGVALVALGFIGRRAAR